MHDQLKRRVLEANVELVARGLVTEAWGEEVACTAYHTLTLRPEQGPLGQALLDKHFLRKHGADAYYGQR